MDFYNQRWTLCFAQNNATTWAITIGWCTFYSTPKKQVTVMWQKHEDCHKRQWKKYWYIGFLVAYTYEHLKHGYENNKFEIEADKAMYE